MSYRELTLTPISTFEVRPTTEEPSLWNFSSRAASQSTRIFNVHKITPKNEGNVDEPKYIIDTAATRTTVPVWPLNSTQVVAIYDSKTPKPHIRARTANCLEQITQRHSAISRFMCCSGSIRPETPKTESDPTIDLHGDDTKKFNLCDGLGHGSWYDASLEAALGFPSCSGGHSIVEERVEWRGLSGKWETRLKHTYTTLHWDGKGDVEGGGLVLTGQDRVLAMYKPRSARWKGDSETEKGERGSRDRENFGVLGICHEGIDDDMARHILASAISIEDEIMRSKGFDARAYHAGWQ